MIKDIFTIAMIPLIFFFIVVLSVWCSFKLADLLKVHQGGWREVLGWITHMTICFWGLGLAISTCVVWVLFMTGNLP